MIDDLDILRVANLLLKRYGADTAIRVAQRADELSADGARDGYAIWKRILEAVGELTRTPMPYLVKWIANGQARIARAPRAYVTPVEAIDFACTVLKLRPDKIWIEGPSGIRIEQETIERNCEARGMR